MKKIFFLVLIFGVFTLLFLLYPKKGVAPVQTESSQNLNQNLPLKQNISSNSNSEKKQNKNSNQNQNEAVLPQSDLYPPLDRVAERVSKKTFGLFVTKKNSPIQPERFQGFHTGIDLEVFAEELKIDVPVLAACSGQIKMKKRATGFGGVMVTSCKLEGQDITAVYGHLKLESVSKNVGDSVQVGEKLGILGAPYSDETDGERKHLHFGFHKGTVVNILGYVQNETELKNWINPCVYFCNNVF